MYEDKSWQIEDLKFILSKYSPVIRWHGDEDESVLHYGCNGVPTTRFLMPHLPKNIKNLLCVDTDGEKIKFSDKYHPHPKIDYKLIDSEAWHLKTSFDHIFSFYSIDGGSDIRLLIENAHKHLNPNGDFVFTVLNKHSIDRLLSIFESNHNLNEDAVKSLNYNRTIKRSAKEIKQMLGDVGFGEVFCQDFNRYHVFPNKAIFKRYAVTYLKAQDIPVGLMNHCIDMFLSEEAKTGRVKYIGRHRSVIAVHYTLTFVYARKFVRRKSGANESF